MILEMCGCCEWKRIICFYIWVREACSVLLPTIICWDRCRVSHSLLMKIKQGFWAWKELIQIPTAPLWWKWGHIALCHLGSCRIWYKILSKESDWQNWVGNRLGVISHARSLGFKWIIASFWDLSVSFSLSCFPEEYLCLQINILCSPFSDIWPPLSLSQEFSPGRSQVVIWCKR